MKVTKEDIEARARQVLLDGNMRLALEARFHRQVAKTLLRWTLAGHALKREEQRRLIRSLGGWVNGSL